MKGKTLLHLAGFHRTLTYIHAILDLNKNLHSAISASVEQLHSAPLPSGIELNSVDTSC